MLQRKEEKAKDIDESPKQSFEEVKEEVKKLSQCPKLDCLPEKEIKGLKNNQNELKNLKDLKIHPKDEEEIKDNELTIEDKRILKINLRY